MKVAVVTGTRAEYGIWRPVLRALVAARGLELQLVVTGMHLLTEFGQTVRTIEADGWEIAARVRMYQKGETAAESLARGTAGLGRAFRELKSELVLVLGDRLEMLAAATAAMCEKRLIGHVHGGEVAVGQWDEQIRHAITKLAQVHFAATQRAAARIVRMGEEPGRVFVTGAPALDLARVEAESWNEYMSRRDSGAGALLVLHPSSGDDEVEYRRALLVLKVLLRQCHLGECSGAFPRLLVVGPNNDPGYKGILRAYRNFTKEQVHLEMSCPQDEFWRHLHFTKVLVGNSSAGIIEAATFACPVVNIGERQVGRERNGNVIDVGWKAAEITAAVRQALSDQAFRRRVARRKNAYGDGHAAERIVRVLQQMARRRDRSPTKRFWDGR